MKNWQNTGWTKEDREVLEAAPKALLYEIARRMAVMVHGTSCDDFHQMPAAVMKEWSVLFENEIVPQKPPGRLLGLCDGRLPA